ncbi:MAG: hypothetical protein ACI9T8_000584 [Candidatus Saccharimonadales bacterium]|jgi:hypothetical protein
MATIRTACESHGDLELATSDVVAVVYESVRPEDSINPGYRFECPIGGEIVLKDAEDRTVDLLVGSGCLLKVITLVFDTGVGPPVDHNEIISFWEKMNSTEGDQALERLWTGE